MTIEYNFESREAYLKWCDEQVRSIYYANIAMNSDHIREVVQEIATKMWCGEHQAMYP